MPRIIPSKIGLFFLLLVAASSTANADAIIARATGLTSPQTTIDFGTALHDNFTVITNQFAGVTFSTNGDPWLYETTGTPFNGISLGHLSGGGVAHTTYSIQFSGPVTEAAFTFKAFPKEWKLTASRNGVEVESLTFTAAGDGSPTGTVRNYGFENITFDTLTIVRTTPDVSGFEFDNLQFSLLTLIHRFTFNGATVVDSVGTATGTLFNGASLAGGNLVLNGTTAYVQLNQKIVPIGGSPFSVTLVAKQSSMQTGFVEMISQGSSNGLGFYIGHRPNRIMRFTDQFQFSGTPFPSDGLFHCYALTSDATGTRFFIDSNEVFTSGTRLTPDNSGIGTRFGRQFPNFNEFFHGVIDDVQVYSGALSGAEITTLCDAFTTQLVDIDIKPRSDPSSWPCKKTNESLPVAILSTDTFDATSVDADTVFFGTTNTAINEVHEKNGSKKRHVEDVNKDGRFDMVFHFRFGDTGFSCADIPGGENSVTLSGILTGATNDGSPIQGEDTLRLVRK